MKTQLRKFLSSRRSTALATAFYLLAVSYASAQDLTWTGGQSNNGNSGAPGNWSEGAPATNTGYHVIYDPVNLLTPFRTTNTYNTTGFQFLSISLAGNETYPGFALLGTGTTLNGPITVFSGAHNFNVATTVTTNTTWDIASGAQITAAPTGVGNIITLAANRTLTKTGAGTLSFIGSQTNVTGTIQLNEGSLIAQSAAAWGTAALVLNSGSLVLQRNANTSYGNNATVAGNVTVTSQNTAADSAGLTHTLGTLAIGAHTLTVNSGSNVSSGTAAITFGATTLSGNADFNVLNNVSGVTTRLRLGAVAGDGFGFTKTGAGELELTAAGTATGTVRIGAGSLILGHSSALASQTLDMDAGDTGTLGLGSLTAATIGVLTGSRGILLENNSSAAVTLTLGADSAANVPSNYSGIFSGSGGVVKGGPQTLTLTGNSTFTGRFTLGRAAVAINRIGNASEDAPLGRNGVVILGSANNASRLDYLGAGESTDKQFQIGSGGVGGTAGSRIDNIGSGALVFANAQFNSADVGATASATRTLTLGGSYAGGVNRIDGAIVDNNATNLIGVTVSAGTWQLGGINTYTGATTVSAGSLIINGSTDASSVLTVASGATLGGSGTIGGAATINGIHSPGNSPGIQTFSSDLTYGGTPTVQWELTANTTTQGDPLVFDQIFVGGNLNFSVATTLTLNFALSGSTVDWNNSLWASDITGTAGWLLYDVTGTLANFGNLSISVENWMDGQNALFNTVRTGSSFTLFNDGNDIYLNYAVPEPSTYALLALAAAGLGAHVVRRRRQS